jgi:superfamily I DNA/RNA helicase
LEKTSQVIIGGPGTGKTTALLKIVDEHLSNGIDPERIAFLSFTRKGANVAIERAMKKFGLAEKPSHFRTIHSLAYWKLGLSPTEVMSKADYEEICEMTGIEMKFVSTAEGDLLRGADGDKFMNILTLSAAKMQPLKQTWEEYQDFIDWHHLKYFADAIKSYKEEIGKYDFSDMISLYIEEGENIDIDVLIVNEAQDLSSAQ